MTTILEMSIESVKKRLAEAEARRQRLEEERWQRLNQRIDLLIERYRL